MDLRYHLANDLRRLRMPGMLETLEMRIKEATEGDYGYLAFFQLLVQDEIANRETNNLAKPLKAANLSNRCTFESFDFRFNARVLPAQTLRDLATCHILDRSANIILCGPPRIGKTHGVKAIGHQACRAGYQVLFRSTQRLLSDLCACSIERAQRELAKAIKVDLLILDDFAFRSLNQKDAELLYVLADARLGTASMVLTSNRPPQDWYGIFPDPVVVGAILDRMVSAAIKLITTKGRSYRREVMGSAKSGKTAASVDH